MFPNTFSTLKITSVSLLPLATPQPLVYLFAQLQLCKVPLFKEAVDSWHIAYLEAKLPGLNPEKLLKMADDKIQVLKHVDQWKESDNVEIMALKLELQKQKQDSDIIIWNLVAHVSRISHAHHFPHNNMNQKHPLPNSTPSIPTHMPKYPPWMIIPPQHPMETKLVDRHLYTWCTKCRQGQGLWVCRHNTETHIDGFTNQHNQKRRLDRNGMGQVGSQLAQPSGYRHQHPTVRHSPPAPTVQLSLLDYLDNSLPDDESHYPEETP
jgi:hypothetical protein